MDTSGFMDMSKLQVWFILQHKIKQHEIKLSENLLISIIFISMKNIT